jgi:hypothetical protein
MTLVGRKGESYVVSSFLTKKYNYGKYWKKDHLRLFGG